MIVVVFLMMLGSAAGAQAEPAVVLRASAAGELSEATLAGAWTGHWAATDSAATGPAEIIFTNGPERGQILAQFTFMDGAQTFKSRRTGTAVDGRARFEAPDDGEIVLWLAAPERLVGDFSSGPTLPAAQGVIEATRAR